MDKCYWKFLLAMLLLLIPSKTFAQDSVWTLSRCINYAKDNNLNIQNAAINEKIAQAEVEQNIVSILPSLYLSSSYGKSFGRSINPTSNQFENNSYEYTGINGGSSIKLFNWFVSRNTIKKSKIQEQIASVDKQQLQNDVSLNITAFYLQALLAKERIATAKEQVNLSVNNITITDALHEAGKVNGLDAAQVKTQLMKDSAVYIKALLDYQQTIIDIKMILNVNFQMPFAVSEEIGNFVSYDLPTPEDIYLIAISWLPSVKSNDLKITSAKKEIDITRGMLYPSLSLGYSTGSNYSSTFYENLPNGEQQLMSMGKQLQNNISQSFSLSLNIPIFDNLSTRYTVKKYRFIAQQLSIQKQENLLQLKQDIYKSHNDVRGALKVYYASKSVQELSSIAYEYAKQRYSLGLISANDLLLAQKDKNLATVEEQIAKYDLMFKIKVVEYYLNK